MGWRVFGAIAAGMVGLGLAGCGVASEFTCQADAQCVGQGVGMCQPDGHCSFPAADCPSGQRYGEHSGAQAGECVGEGGSSSSSSGPGPASGSVGTAPLPSESTEPALDTGPAASEGEATSLPATSGPVVSTSDDGSDATTTTTGEPEEPELALWLELEGVMNGEATDASEHAWHGTCAPLTCPELTRGAVGQAVWFDGEDDLVVVPHAPWLETTEGFTIAAWVRLDGLPPPGHHAVLAKPLGEAIDNSWELYFDGPELTLGMASNGEHYGVFVPWMVMPEVWVHLAGTWDGMTLTLWIDGDEAGSIPSPAVEFDDHPVMVGADDDHLGGPSGFLLGAVDDVRVYRRALAPDEILVLAGG